MDTPPLYAAIFPYRVGFVNPRRGAEDCLKRKNEVFLIFSCRLGKKMI